MSGLVRTKDTSGASYLQVTEGYPESAAELGELPYRVQAFLRDLGQHLAALEREIRVGALVGSADASAQLVELRQSHVVGILNDQRVDVRHVHAGFYNCGADQYVKASVKKLPPYFQHLLLGHLAVSYPNARLRNKRAYLFRTAVDGVYAVMDIIHLTAAAEFLLYRLHDNSPVVLHDIGSYRLSVLGRLVNYAHVAYSAHRHVERSRDRRC